MSADQIFRAYELRMWFLWMPILAVLAVALYFVLPMPNGLPMLTQMLFAIITLCALADWCTAEIAAFRAEAAHQG